MRKVVITGALGHIGSRLIREIPSRFADIEILMIDNLATQRYCSLFSLPEDVHYRFIETDVLTADLDEFFECGDVVIHLAANVNFTGSGVINDSTGSLYVPIGTEWDFFQTSSL